MLRKRVSVLLVSAAMVIGCMVFPERYQIALSCPAPPPMPLRALCDQSERIVVGRFGASRVIKAEGDSLLLRTALHVSSTIKGKDDAPIVFYEHWVWTNDALTTNDYSKGTNVLAFLTRAEGEPYSIFDQRYGLKELSDSDLKSYLQRISELAKITESGNPDPADLVEWLVRCAEDPATRWEGAYELNISASMAEDSADSEEDAKAIDEDEASEEDDRPDINSPAEDQEAEVDEEENLVSTFALLLTESQRTRLVDALIASEKTGVADSDLISLASRSNDPRLVPFLVSQLRRETGGEFYVIHQMMDVVARALGDKTLASLALKYSESDAGADDEEAPQPDSAIAPDAAAADTKKAVLQSFLERVQKRLRR